MAAGSAASLDGRAIAAVLAAARDGIVLRGKAEVGDKTMIDALDAGRRRRRGGRRERS